MINLLPRMKPKFHKSKVRFILESSKIYLSKMDIAGQQQKKDEKNIIEKIAS